MWHWDQGHLAYFQFDSLRRIARFVLERNLKEVGRVELEAATGLPFAAPETHSPWRNYSRALKLALLVYEQDDIARPTAIARLLASPGAVTSDEYLHFLATASTEPSPALTGWSARTHSRYPLLFSLKYLLAKRAMGSTDHTSLDEIIAAYDTSGFVGDEDEEAFARLVGRSGDYSDKILPDNSLRRQARESLKVLCQVSYLVLSPAGIHISLDPSDASEVFNDLHPVLGPKAENSESEISRLAELFRDGPTNDFYEYPNSSISKEVESGFLEGSKSKRSHLTIERNAQLRRAFFATCPTSVCDVCSMDTAAAYPWTQRVLDLHHLLPLSSGARVRNQSTTLDDLVALCPSCHRAVHRYYDQWLCEKAIADFRDEAEAREVYEQAKRAYRMSRYD